ncbi:ectoine utilization protein EutA [Benzoatithermus flavus]|uniref:Ectoine utilization protein EutA n=1 Tax=Benzoatithermus flavus TaxID=3108223 RepID=A0ABU8XTR2_9PROT
MHPAEIAQTTRAPALDARPVPRRIGLIVLATDHTSERDFARMTPFDEVGVYATRVAYANPTNPANLRAMQPRLTEAAALILPDEPLDALCFSCTSASVVIGDDAVEAALRAAKPGVPVVTPPAAARDGFRALGVGRISLLTPYTRATTAPMADYFAGHGLGLASVTCLGFEDDREMARIRPQALVEAAVAATDARAEALFVSCTALRSAEIAEAIEAAIGRPVVTSNQATVWRCLRHCRIDRPFHGHGRLLHLPAEAGR